jgi:type I restriction enzyme, S subunit
MSEWKKVRLDQCSQIVGGSTPKTSTKEYWDGDIYWATPKDLSNLKSKYLDATPRTITKKGLDSCGAEILPVNSVLFSSRAPIGHVAVNRAPMATNQGFKSFVPDLEKLDALFLYYWLRSNRAYFNNLGNGATFKEVSKSIVSQVEIPLPPIAQQKRIAAILDQAEALRSHRREAIGLLDELGRSVFLEMFGDAAKNDRDWKTEQMGDLIQIRRGASPRPIDAYMGGSVNWIKIGDGTKGSEIYLETCADKVTEDGAKKSVFLKSGSLIFANCGVSLGFARILKIDGCIHDGWLSFENIPEERLNKIFLLKALNSITEYFRAMAPAGTQPNLNTGLMKNFRVILPPLPLQQEFAQRIAAIEALKATQREALSQLDALFASLQHRAFRGEL